jgi:hypothetical protein
MWEEFGSPRGERTLVERLTHGRAGPWRFWPFYVLLATAFALAAVAVLVAVRRLGEDAASEDEEGSSEDEEGAREEDQDAAAPSPRSPEPGDRTQAR